MPKIKILYTIPNFYTAGSGKVVYDLVNGLDSTKFEVAIACNHNRGAFFKEVEDLGYPIHIMKTTVPYRSYFSLYSRLKPIIQFFKNNEFDIIHSWHWSSDWTEALAARLAGVKWIYTKKAMNWGNKHWKIRSFLANYIITINDEMKKYFPKKKAQKLIPIGINTDYYKPQKLAFIEDSKTFRVITVANLVPIKGIEVLIKSINLIKDEKITLKVVGDNNNEYGKTLLQLSKDLNLENQIEFTGKVGDVRPLIEESDIFVIPTINNGEGQGIALIEAMCMAIPVLGSDISGINFVLKNFKNLLFEAGNTTELSKKILEVKNLSKQERIKLGSELREYIMENFNYNKFIEAHQKLYKEIIK